MSARNRPNSNTDSGLTPIGRGPAGERPGSPPERNAAGSPRAPRPALRRLFAPGTRAAAAATPADVDALVALLGHPGLDTVGDVAPAAAAGPAAGVEAETSSRPGTGAPVTGPDVEPDIVPTTGSGVQVLAAADRSRAFTTSPPAAPAAGA